jgi:hypothetical protein
MLQPNDVERSREFIPAEFEIIPVLPGKTPGGLYFAVNYNLKTKSSPTGELFITIGAIELGRDWINTHFFLRLTATLKGDNSIHQSK